MANLPEWRLKQQIVEVGRKMYDRGLVVASDGNISIRARGQRLWITPTGICLGEIQTRHLVCVDRAGRTIGPGTPSSEVPLHAAVYSHRPDVVAVVHAHPPIASAFTYAGRADLLAKRVLPEVVLTFGSIPTADYATPASQEGPGVIQELIRDHDALMLDRHGSLTVGSDVLDAYYKLEKLEHAATIILTAERLGGARTLSDDELGRLGQ